MIAEFEEPSEEVDYPYVSNINYVQGTASAWTIKPEYGSVFWQTPYGEEDETDLLTEDGFATSIVNRAYVPAIHSESTFEIDNYRLMCFELVEYMYGILVDEEPAEYKITVRIDDATEKIMAVLYSMAKEALEAVTEYKDLANESLVYNSDLGRFNSYFVDSILKEYEADPASAPWVLAPVIYSTHTDLFYNRFDNLESAQDEAKYISNQINPTNGNLDSLNAFVENLDDFVKEAYKYFIIAEQNYNTSLYDSLEESIQAEGIEFTNDYPLIYSGTNLIYGGS